MTFVADSFKEIAGAVKRLRWEREDFSCFTCEGLGWVRHPRLMPPFYETCDGCRNPKGMPSPEKNNNGGILRAYGK